MDERRLDGNAAAGILAEVFATEISAAVGICDGCGAAEAIGAVHLYRGAGLVLRCPHCDTALIRVVVAPHRTFIDVRGLRSLEVAV